MRAFPLFCEGFKGAVGLGEAAVPFVRGDPATGGDAFFLLRYNILFLCCHGEPRGLFEVPFVRGRVGSFEPDFGSTEEVVGFYRRERIIV